MASHCSKLFSVTEQHETVGRAVRSAREARGRTLRSTAAELGVSPATLSAVENGRTPLTVERLQQLAELLDVPAPRLLAGERTPAPVPVGGSGDDRDWRDFSSIQMGPVLEAATRVFVRNGFHAAAMREVASEAGLSVAGIYHHYPSKQQILFVLLDVTMAEIRWRIAAARDQGAADGPARAFALMVEALALFHAVRGDLAFLGASEMRGLTGAEYERVVGLRNDVQYALDEQARLGLESGVFTCEDPHTTCRAIATMCTSLPGWFRADGRLSAQQVAQRYAGYALALMGVSARPATRDALDEGPPCEIG
jgi:AcrR family transcriptional regulator/transcriptional regulator with XRE-family HTH domain